MVYEPKTGRSKFDAGRKKIIIEVLELGASMETAAAIARITPVTLYRWLRKGEDASEESQYGKFYLDVQEARAKPRQRALVTVSNELDDDPTMAWKFLERREPGFAPPSTRISGPANPVVIQLSFSNGQALPGEVAFGDNGDDDIEEGEVIEVGLPASLPSGG